MSNSESVNSHTIKPDRSVSWNISRTINHDSKLLFQACRTRKEGRVTWLFRGQNHILYDGTRNPYLRHLPEIMGLSCVFYMIYNNIINDSDFEHMIKKKEEKWKREEELSKKYHSGYKDAVSYWSNQFGLSIGDVHSQYGNMIKVMEYDRKAREEKQAIDKLRANVQKLFPPSS
jgi:hypothetical protein